MVEYRGLIANISSAAWSNTEKSEARDGIFIHQKSDEGNVSHQKLKPTCHFKTTYPEGDSMIDLQLNPFHVILKITKT